MIQIHENALPQMIYGVAVLPAKKDGMKCYVARSGRQHGWGLTIGEALAALNRALAA